MINEITCNSNNTIELSRGQLLQWLNNLLKINYTKIQQMGSGAAYCQLLDLIYPGKVPMTKINWKAKNQYEYLQNFKVLQQSFMKLHIMRHVEVQKLVKCKYQDNLQLLQWFKKIFDTTAPPSSKQYDPITRRGQKTQKQNKQPSMPRSASYQKLQQTSSIKIIQNKEPQQKQSLNKNRQSVQRQSPRKNIKFMGQIQTNTELRLVDLMKQNQDQQKMFYLRKISQIEHLMEQWDTAKTSMQLIGEIRKIILVAPETQWGIDNGQYIESLDQKLEGQQI